MTKRSLSFILALVLALSAFAPSVMAADDIKYGYTDERGKIGYGKLVPVTDDHTIVEAHIECSVTGYEMVNGERHAITMVTADGSTHITSIIDLDDQTVLHKFVHDDFGGYGYFGFAHPDGRLVMSCTGGDIMEYNPETHELRHVGKIKTNSRAGGFCGFIYDEATDTIYSTEHTTGYINATNLTTGQNTLLASLSDHYLRSAHIAVIGDYLYTSGHNTGADGNTAHLFKVDKYTGDYEIIENPDDRLYSLFNYTFSMGNYIVTQGTLREGGSVMFSYNTETGEWKEFDNTKYLISTSMIGMGLEPDQRIFKNAITGTICKMDLDLNITDTGIAYGSHLRGTGTWVELKDPTMQGLNAVTAQFNGNIYVWNFETGKTKQIDVMVPGPSVPHRISYYDNVNGLVWVGGYKAGSIAAVNVKTGEVKIGPGDQPEGMIVDQNTGLFYHGDYSGAHIREKNVSEGKEWGKFLTGERGQYADFYFGSIGSDQDRPFDLDISGRELWIASMPNTHTPNPGALTVWNLDTLEKQVFQGIIPGQSILTVDTSDKYAYIGSSATVGTGQAVSEDPAQIAMIDIKTKEIVKQIPFAIPGVSGDIVAVHSLDLSPDGTKLYAAGTGIYAMYDAETLELLKYNVYGAVSVNAKVGAQAWHSQRFYFEPKTGYIIHGDSWGGRVIDPDTLQIVLEAPGYGWFCGFDDHNAYFVNGTQVFKAPLIIGDDKSYLLSGVSFFKTGEDVMYRNGDEVPFDTYEDNGRVMVPLRNAASSMGGIVTWDAKTNTATITNAAGNVLSLNTGDHVVKFDGKGKMFGVYMKVENGVTYIPMQTLCDFLNVELVEARGINFIAEAGSNYKPSQELLDYIESEVY